MTELLSTESLAFPSTLYPLPLVFCQYFIPSDTWFCRPKMMFKQGKDVQSFNYWKRPCVVATDDLNFEYYMKHLASKRPKFYQRDENEFLDIHTKGAALRVSPSVVALISYSGEEELIQGCGTIIQVDDSNAGIVLTSANLIRKPTKEEVVQHALADNLKVTVFLSDGTSYQGEICIYDFHYNFAIIKFMAKSPLQCAKLRYIDDSIDLSPHQFEETPIQNRPHLDLYKLIPGDDIITVGRYFAKPFDLMAAPGKFSLDCCDYDCKELLYATCRMTRCGDGGPVINRSGEVIGVAFYERGFTPMMPINIVMKSWEHHKNFGVLCRPYVGMKATNFYAADLELAEKVIRRFPSISKGVLVEKVNSGSAAFSAGLCLNDVIIQCAGKPVQGFLELIEMMLDNVGRRVNLVVLRADQVTPLHLEMMIADAKPNEFYSWPHLITEFRLRAFW